MNAPLAPIGRAGYFSALSAAVKRRWAGLYLSQTAQSAAQKLFRQEGLSCEWWHVHMDERAGGHVFLAVGHDTRD